MLRWITETFSPNSVQYATATIQQKFACNIDKGKSTKASRHANTISGLLSPRKELNRPGKGMTKLSKVQTTTILTFVIGTLFYTFFRASSTFFRAVFGSALFLSRKCFDCFAGRVSKPSKPVLFVCGQKKNEFWSAKGRHQFVFLSLFCLFMYFFLSSSLPKVN